MRLTVVLRGVVLVRVVGVLVGVVRVLVGVDVAMVEEDTVLEVVRHVYVVVSVRHGLVLMLVVVLVVVLVGRML